MMMQTETSAANTPMHWPGLAGKVAIVSGGASGMGEACVESFAAAGCRVVVSDIDTAKAQSAVEALKTAGAEAMAVTANIADREQVEQACRQVVEHFGAVDILVNCAGINEFASCEQIEPEQWERILRVNLDGTWHYAKAVMPHMIKNGRGKIVNIGSAASVLGIPKAAPYVTSKHGMIGLTRALAIDLAAHQINVNCICPSTIDTPMLRRETSPVFSQQMIERIPLGRLGKLSDISSAVMFLTSDLSDWITGVTLPVDGGLTCCVRAHHYE